MAEMGKDKIGGNAGVGLTFALANDSQIYVEVKYHRMESTPQSTSWVPVTVGYRW